MENSHLRVAAKREIVSNQFSSLEWRNIKSFSIATGLSKWSCISKNLAVFGVGALTTFKVLSSNEWSLTWNFDYSQLLTIEVLRLIKNFELLSFPLLLVHCWKEFFDFSTSASVYYITRKKRREKVYIVSLWHQTHSIILLSV